MQIPLLFISGAEIIIILLIALLLFGSKNIPGAARTIGKGFREFNKLKDDVKREISSAQDPTIAKNPTKMQKSSEAESDANPEDSKVYDDARAEQVEYKEGNVSEGSDGSDPAAEREDSDQPSNKNKKS